MSAETNREKPLRLALIGMSGAGKTFWTKKLAAAEYPAVSCDDRIEQKLAPRLAAGGYAGINGVAAWMGWPDSPAYGQRESDYLTEEIHTLDEVLIERYLNDPKPVLWRGAFQPKPKESPHETVARCYPALIAARRQSYEALAHCTLQVASLRDDSLVAAEFLKMIQIQIEGTR